MASIVLQRKLDSLHRCLERVQTKCPAQAQTLAGDPDLQDIVVLNLNRAVQLCVDMAVHVLAEAGVNAPDTMGEAFDELASRDVVDAALAKRLRKAVGFRNIAVHNYDRINWNIVHAIATTHLQDFHAFAKAVWQAQPRANQSSDESPRP